MVTDYKAAINNIMPYESIIVSLVHCLLSFICLP